MSGSGESATAQGAQKLLMASAPEAAEATDKKTRKQISIRVSALFSSRVAESGWEGDWELRRRELGRAFGAKET